MQVKYAVVATTEFVKAKALRIFKDLILGKPLDVTSTIAGCIRGQAQFRRAYCKLWANLTP